MIPLTIVIGVMLVYTVKAIPIENGVEGEPEIECGSTAITVNFNIQNSFEGHVYVKGRYTENDCRNDQIGRRVAGISLPFNTCGVKRERSLNPKGIFVSTTVIITFHPHFLTKIDQAYTLQCFYMEADKTVSTELEVSMLTTAFQSQLVPMPICRYQILKGGPQGEPIKYALVGEQVYHKWTCDSDHTDTFCALVHSCYVDDGNGDSVDLIDPNGCALDRHLLNNLDYMSNLMAGQQAHVFKYADRVSLFFQCQIIVSVKEPDVDCKRPTCPDISRGKRAIGALRTSRIDGDTADVSYSLSALDDYLSNDVSSAPSELLPSRPRRTSDDGLCLALPTALAAIFAAAFIAVGTATVLLFRIQQCTAK